MRSIVFLLLVTFITCLIFDGCKEDEELETSPSVPHRIELNDTVYHIGDSLSGRIVVLEDSLIAGTVIKKIECRFANKLIGTVENIGICPFGVRLVSTPVGIHTLSVIIKCEAPGYEEALWRYDYKMIIIKE